MLNRHLNTKGRSCKMNELEADSYWDYMHRKGMIIDGKYETATDYRNDEGHARDSLLQCFPLLKWSVPRIHKEKKEENTGPKKEKKRAKGWKRKNFNFSVIWSTNCFPSLCKCFSDKYHQSRPEISDPLRPNAVTQNRRESTRQCRDVASRPEKGE